MKKQFFPIVVIILCPIILYGQDIHFSQFSNSPAMLNPATTGVKVTDFRFVYNYKNQWKSISSPYKTHAFSYDMPFLKDQLTNGAVAGGISVLSDKAGDLNFGTTQINISIAANKNINANNNISLGIQGGITQKSLQGDLVAQQWDSEYDPNSPSGYLDNQSSGAGIENISYGDFSTGLLWNNDGNILRSHLGVSLFHLNMPKHSLVEGDDKLNVKWVLHGGTDVQISGESIRLIPQFQVLKQGPQSETNLGGMVKYRLQEASIYSGEIREVAIFMGGWYRLGDAFIPCVQFKYYSISFGLSYDITLSDINIAAASKGGFEFSMTYLHPFPPFKKAATPLM